MTTQWQAVGGPGSVGAALPGLDLSGDDADAHRRVGPRPASRVRLSPCEGAR